MKKRGVMVVLVIGLFIASAARLLAHGGGTLQIGREAAGPYLVSVWMDTAAPQAGADLHVTVAVIDAADDTAVLDAEVQVQVTKNGQPILIVSATTADAANKLFYETDFVLEDGGDYDLTIQVDGPLGSGETGFPVVVEGASGLNPLISWGVGLVVLGGTAVYLIRRQQEKR